MSVYRWSTAVHSAADRHGTVVPACPDERWFVDETYAKVAGRWVYLYRAIDQFGQVIDVLVAEKRDPAATRRFLHPGARARPRWP